MILNAQPDMQVIATAGDGREAIAQAERMTPDVVIMDISMPGLNGLAATAQLTERCPAAKVLTLTRHADSSYLQQLLRAGAAGYVLKQSRPAELLHAIRAVATGGKYLDASMTGPVLGTYAKQAASPGPEPTTPLSPRETEVMRLIAWGNTNKEIAARLDLERENGRSAQGERHAEARHARAHRYRALRAVTRLASRLLSVLVGTLHPDKALRVDQIRRT